MAAIVLDIFGTLPDWGSLIISLGGFTLLYATLCSQIEVQKAQQEITRIEQFRHKTELLPEFSLEVSKKEVVPEGEYVKVTYHLTIKSNDKDAMKVRFVFQHSDAWKFTLPPNEIERFSKNTSTNPIALYEGKYIFPNYYANTFLLEITYQDVDKHRYSQVIKFNSFNGDDYITAQPPVEVNI